ncbi:hypothetical protein IC582_026971 [Cucumis melo]
MANKSFYGHLKLINFLPDLFIYIVFKTIYIIKMSYLILEMNVISVEGLEELISSPNLSVYVMVILKGASLKEQNANTHMVEGGQNPIWNFAVKFFIDRRHTTNGTFKFKFKFVQPKADQLQSLRKSSLSSSSSTRPSDQVGTFLSHTKCC